MLRIIYKLCIVMKMDKDIICGKYLRPQLESLELSAQGILCFSLDDMTTDDPFAGNPDELILKP